MIWRTTPVSVVSLPSTYVMGPRPSRFSDVESLPLSLEQAVSVTSEAAVANTAARRTALEI